MAEGDSSPTGGLGELFSQLQAARADLEEQAAVIDATVVEGRAGGGAVVIRLTGALAADSVHIDPSVIDPEDPGLLEDVVLAALRDALNRIIELRSSLRSPVDSPFEGEVDLGALVGNLDLQGLLAGVDVEGLMGNLASGLDLGVLTAFDDDDDDDDDEDEDDDEDDVVDDEPQV